MLESERRLKVLRGEDVNGFDSDLLRWLQSLKRLFPEVPDEILVQIPPRKKWSGDSVPWNRRWRKRLQSSPALVLHLFSGGDPKFWQEGLAPHGLTALCVDKCIDPGHDLLRDTTYHFLMDLCESGRVEALLGGPPCRTVSKLRFRSPGPPPVRTRHGPERFGLKDLSSNLHESVLQDTVLWLRYVWLYALAQDSRDAKVGFLKESPEDPETYKKDDDPVEYPSFFSWPEWSSLKSKYNIFEVSFDQGPFGHETKKPTRLGTNLGLLRELHGVRGPGTGVQDDGATIEQRIQRSRRWAAWAPQLKLKILEAVVAEFKVPLVKKLSEAQWQQHRANDHQPFSSECFDCQVGGGRHKPHLKIHNPDTYTLSVDVCGPFQQGHDQLISKAKYALVGVFTVPISEEGQKLCPTPWDFIQIIEKDAEEPSPEAPFRRPSDSEDVPFFPEIEHLSAEECAEGALSPDARPEPDGGEAEIEEEGGKKDGGEGEDGGQIKEWEDQIDPTKKVYVKNFTLTEILSSRTSTSVLAALNRMVAKLTYLGFSARRLHSDRAAELSSKAVTRWAEQKEIFRTFTSGSDWKSNGRVEAEIGMLKRAANIVMKSSCVDPSYWPLVFRHAAERRGRLQLAELGMRTGKLLPFGQEVVVGTKKWEDFQGHWRARKKKAWIQGPDVSMSLTSGGHYVVDEDGKYMHATDIALNAGPRLRIEDDPSPLPELVELSAKACEHSFDEAPRHRVHGKQSLKSLGLDEVSADDLQDRLHRGCHLANVEAKNLETNMDTADSVMSSLADLDKENGKLVAFLKAIKEYEEGEVADACAAAVPPDEFLQTKTYSLHEVRRDVQPWIESMKAEFESLLSHKAIEVVTKECAERRMEEARQVGKLVEVIPAKGVFTRKAGSGKRKTRVVACGNCMSERETADLYAAGLDATQLRCILKESTLQNWEIGVCDIRTAFLLAPTSQSELIVIQPSRILIDCGVIPEGTMWIVTGALYGLTTAPRDWGGFRDATLTSCRWSGLLNGCRVQYQFQQLSDPNVWQILSTADGSDSTVCGYLAVYVDDLLFVGPDCVIDDAFARIRSMWVTSDFEKVSSSSSLKFCGMELHRTPEGLKIHQESYVHELLQRHSVEISSPYVRLLDDPAPVSDPSPTDVKKAQAIAGELLWVAGRSRPDVAAAVHKMSQWVTRNPCWAIQCGYEVLKYLKHSPNLGLVYSGVRPRDPDDDPPKCPRKAGSIEILSDSSFAPSGENSISGLVILFAGDPVRWHTQKQSLVALSTAEAELCAMVDALQAGRSVRSFVELIHPGTDMVMFGDNRAALILAGGQGGGWRTRHLRIRSSALTDALKRGELQLFHMAGTRLLADALTKLLHAVPLRRFCIGMGMVSPSSEMKALKSLDVKPVSSTGIKSKLGQCLGLLMSCLAFLPDVGGVSTSDDEPSSMTLDWPLLLMLVAVIALW